MMSNRPDVIIDARGHRCPTPTLRLRRALEDSAEGTVIRLLADDPMARIDVPHFVEQAGCSLVSVDDSGGYLTFQVRKFTGRRAR